MPASAVYCFGIIYLISSANALQSNIFLINQPSKLLAAGSNIISHHTVLRRDRVIRGRISSGKFEFHKKSHLHSTKTDNLDELEKSDELSELGELGELDSPELGDDSFLNQDGVVCARGVCVIADEKVAPELCYVDYDETGTSEPTLVCETNEEAPAPGFNIGYLWPRGLLLFCSVLYGTNFPLGRLMNESLPPSAATSARMLLASIALFPFLLQLDAEIRLTALLCGCFTAMGYIAQSLALVDTPGATVAFLGALTVVICPTLAAVVDKRKMGIRDAPQVWLAAILCLFGVGLLELGPELTSGNLESVNDGSWAGDVWSVVQAVGFGTSFFITEKMMSGNPKQALPITAAQVSVSAFISGIWALISGFDPFGIGADSGLTPWLLDESTRVSFALPGLFTSPDLQSVALAVAWTGLITTAGNRVGETLALGKLSSSEASVLLATEPLWAALFSSLLLHETLSGWDYSGGALIVAACCCNAIKPDFLRGLMGPLGNSDKRSSEVSSDE
eukprot:CAMPEP_0113311928 /NCGR_PEP_ID=MMETSP0010_2-20120614/8959_1 /TAXON_ID=216773 ORGANISM="Corethron hystrix, Strain 308" /NCGR_SAMPLE_ID=MMETSP0010_2 /ASSEMBLY_ACC=CAM_ASM_000155 /LENGTH=506 /DNA_ID=CAMNT_0000167645 /DNA_START=141 /DNA_END=1661 /DNA_ORIENTATION=+ /assembly_acc=CAM_ASM_000155